MPLTFTVSRSVQIGPDTPITNALLRLLGLPSFSSSGSIGTGDIAAGAITPSLTSPGAYFYAADTTSTNTYAATYNPAVSSYANGLELFLKITNANTSAASATFNANGLGAKLIYHRNGQAVSSGDLPANSILQLIYNTSLNGGVGGWHLQNVVPSQGTRFGTGGGTANVQTFTTSNMPAANALVGLQNQLIIYKATVANNASMTLNVDGTGAKTVKLRDNVSLLGGEVLVNDTVMLTYDSTLDVYVLLNRQENVGIVAAARNLLAFNNTATPNSKIDVTLDEVTLEASSGMQFVVHGVGTYTVDITASGANGLDTGAEAANTWYYLWVIFNRSQVSLLLSVSSTAPTMPSGYTYKALIGAVRNDAGSNFVAFRQHDRRVWTTEQVVLAAQVPGANDTWEVLAAGNITAFRAAIPPIARSCSGFVGTDNTTDVASLMLAAVAEDGTLTAIIVGPQLVQIPNIGTAYNSFGAACPFDSLPVRGGASYNIQWKSRLTTLSVSLSISAWEF